MQPQLIAGRYQVLRAIGRGGMGTVWLCRDEVLGREVAVKQIGALPGESATQTKRAMREARSAAALNHPNAVAVYDVVDHGGLPWLVMEYVEGQTLADEISRDGRLSPQRVADIGAQLAGALARAHERRIIHRDIKPGNVLLDKAGRPKISDFGIARGHGDEQLTQVGFITGTPGFLSPELARGGDPQPASDVWALGATLYAAVEGQSPYETRSNPIALLRAIATERPRPMTHAGALGPAIDAMMDEDPARRWDMATCAQRLRGVARITTIMPRVDLVGTAAIPVPRLEPTQRLEAPSPVPETRVAAVPDVAVPVARPQVAPVPHVAVPVAKTRVAPVPHVAVPVAKTRVATVAVPVVAAPVARAPAVAASVAEALAAPVPVAAPLVARRPVSQGPRVRADGARVPPRTRRTRPGWLPLVLLALLVAGLGVAYLSHLGDPASTTATSRNAPARPAATGTSKASQPPGATASPNAGRTLESFVTSYYSTVTADTAQTWGRLTPTMQRAAGGRKGYDGFWRTIARVRVNSAQANAPTSKAVANLTFTRNDGTTSTETHQFTFVAHNGGYLIESDRLVR